MATTIQTVHEVTRSCGHVEQVDLQGVRYQSQVAQRLERERQRDCRDCYRARTVKADLDAEAAGKRAVLEGSDRQVDWARSLRQRRATELHQWLQRITTIGDDLVARAFINAARRDQVLQMAREAIVHAMKGGFPESQTARFWIESRTETPIAFASVIFPSHPVNGAVEVKHFPSLPPNESAVFYDFPAPVAATTTPEAPARGRMGDPDFDDSPF